MFLEDEAINCMIYTSQVKFRRLCWGEGDRNPVGARFSMPFQAGPVAHPDSCAVGTVSFPGIKKPWRRADRPPLSNAEVASELEAYHRLPSVPAQTCRGVTFAFTVEWLKLNRDF